MVMEDNSPEEAAMAMEDNSRPGARAAVTAVGAAVALCVLAARTAVITVAVTRIIASIRARLPRSRRDAEQE